LIRPENSDSPEQAGILKETELVGEFISDLFVSVLGYTGPRRMGGPPVSLFAFRYRGTHE
jgi:hypothetical protein